MNQRIEHIESLEKLVKSQTDNLSTIQTKSILEVIGILTFITNVEYTNLIKQSKKFDKDNFIAELTRFLQDDLHWKKISNKRKTEFEELKIIAKSKGFLLVSSSPLTRSSYHADEDFALLKKNRLKN